MFSVTPNGTYVASKNVKIKPHNLAPYGPDDEIKFDIPPYHQFINPQETYISFDLQMTNNAFAGRIAPDKRAGAHALFRTVQIRSGDDATQLVYEDDYNLHQALTREYTKNPSIQHLREMFEGTQPSPSLAGMGGTVLYKKRDFTTAVTRAAVVDTADVSKQVAKTARVKMRLNCGLLGGDKVIPAIAMNGIKLTLTTETAARALCYDDYDSNGKHIGSEDSGFELNSSFANAAISKGSAFGAFTVKDGAGNALKVASDAIGFDLDDTIYVKVAATETSIGHVSKIESDSGNYSITVTADADIADAVAVTFVAGSKVYFKVSDRKTTRTVNDSASLTRVVMPPSFQMSNVEMEIQTVAPPESYVSGMISQVGKGGVELEYSSYTLYRFNLTTAQGTMTQEIPATETLARSIMSVPVFLADFQSYDKSSFLPSNTDDIERYMYQHGLKQIPRRRVELGRYSNAVAGTNARCIEPIHLEQAQKALVNAGFPVRNLHNVNQKFFIGRAFTRYGQIYNLRDETLSLQTTYKLGSSAQNKMYNHYVHGVRIMKIGAMGVEVMK